jgi:hypothetical protein
MSQSPAPSPPPNNQLQIPSNTPSVELQIQQAEALYENIQPSSSTISIAPWLLNSFGHHKKRIVNLSKKEKTDQKILDNMTAKHSTGQFPAFLQELQPLKALESCPDLQPKWNNIFSKYREDLFETFIQDKKAKIEQYHSLCKWDGLVTKEFLADVKKAALLEIQKAPANEASFKAEEKAVLNYWLTHREEMIKEGKKAAIKELEDLEKKRETRESHSLDVINISSPAARESSMGSYSVRSSSYDKTTTIHQPTEVLSIPYPQPQASLQYHQTWNQGQGKRVPKRKRYEHELQQEQGQRKHFLASHNRRRSRSQLNNAHKSNELIIAAQLDASLTKIHQHNLRELGIADKNIHNLSGKALSAGAINCLALGTKFIPTPKIDNSIISFSMKQFRKTIRLREKFRDEQSDMPKYWIGSNWEPPYMYNRTDIERLLDDLEQSLTPETHHNPVNYNKKDLIEYKKLLSDPDILVILADKNLGYAVVTTEWYMSKCLDHLHSNSYSDVTDEYHQGINGIPTSTHLVNSLNDLINNSSDILDPDEIRWITQEKEWKPMKFYITAKVHKQPIKGRPIVPSMSWMTFHLSQWIAHQLNPLITHTEWVLKDSYELLTDIQNINKNKLPSQLRIASADVEALYPNMDIKTGIQLTSEFLEEINWETSRKREFIISAMTFVLTKGYIEFQGKIYQQTNGAAMGSPMIPPYANIFMYMLEKPSVYHHMTYGNLLLYKRFIDDIFIITKNDNTDELQNDLNSMNPLIKLTWSKVSTKCNFLDLIIEYSPSINKIHTKVYQKELNNYAYLPFHSHHTLAQKKGFIKGEAIRYARICSHKGNFETMIKVFILRLQKRGYPLSFIINSLKSVHYKDRTKYHANNSKPKNSSIPLLFKTVYNPTLSTYTIRRALNQFTEKLKGLRDSHKSFNSQITICYKVPPKLHELTLKARKKKKL